MHQLAFGGKSEPMKPTASLVHGLTVGLLGGSFNPAHGGHVEMSAAARRALGLSRVWWLVSPQNPLKVAEGYQPFDHRVRHARALTKGTRWLTVTDLEASLPSRFTADTLAHLKERFPKTRFVWLMGADNLAGFHHWDRWEEIAKAMPICVVSRPGYDMAALKSVAARRLASSRVALTKAPSLAKATAPAWLFLPTVHNPLSATALRAESDSPKEPL